MMSITLSFRSLVLWNSLVTVEFKTIPYRVLLFFELFIVIFFQDWAGWGIFTVIPGNPQRTKGGSQHLEARPELQDWLRSELFFTVKNSRTGPFSNYLGNNFELYSNFNQGFSWVIYVCFLCFFQGFNGKMGSAGDKDPWLIRGLFLGKTEKARKGRIGYYLISGVAPANQTKERAQNEKFI